MLLPTFNGTHADEKQQRKLVTKINRKKITTSTETKQKQMLHTKN